MSDNQVVGHCLLGRQHWKAMRDFLTEAVDAGYEVKWFEGREWIYRTFVIVGDPNVVEDAKMLVEALQEGKATWAR